MDIIVREKFYEINASEGKYITDGSGITTSVMIPLTQDPNKWYEVEGTFEELEAMLRDVPGEEIEHFLRELLESEEVSSEELENYLKTIEL